MPKDRNPNTAIWVSSVTAIEEEEEEEEEDSRRRRKRRRRKEKDKKNKNKKKPKKSRWTISNGYVVHVGIITNIGTCTKHIYHVYQLARKKRGPVVKYTGQSFTHAHTCPGILVHPSFFFVFLQNRNQNKIMLANGVYINQYIDTNLNPDIDSVLPSPANCNPNPLFGRSN